jgi:molecular chaperone Hsp33
VNDYLVRIISKTENVMALACVTTGLVDEARRRHDCWPTAAAALGRALTGGALLGAQLKTGQRLALKFEGNGPLKKIIVEAESNGAVCGYVAVPQVNMVDKKGKLDVGGALGRAGFLTVTKDLGLKEPYRGMVQLYTSEIAEDIAYYLTGSEQIPSAVGLGVFVGPDNQVSVAGGFLIQTLPPADNELVDRLMAHIEQLPPITQLLRDGKTPEQLLELLFSGIPYKTLEKRALSFRCTCSREKVERTLISLGATEIADVIERDGGAEVTCEFCREAYSFSRDELEGLLGEIGASATTH